MQADGLPSVRAMQNSDVDVVFQPIVRADDGRFLAYEALVRCRHTAYADPTVLFRAAVEQRACGYIGRVIRSVAFERCPDTPVFINIHPEELTSRWLVRPDDPMGFHEHDVYLEITETAAFTHFELCMKVLREVCDRTGAHLVVDDFGAGHSNLERVFELRPALVKLDGALIRSVNEDVRRRTLIRRLVDMCTDLGAKVVAECVETVDELNALRDAGVHYVQGYLFAVPDFPLPISSWPQRRSRRAPPPERRPSSMPPPTRRRSPSQAARKATKSRSKPPPSGKSPPSKPHSRRARSG
jgi:EAL domain-containing protein (putative c-di-GMP-specific phosphodiesterase class I)